MNPSVIEAVRMDATFGSSTSVTFSNTPSNGEVLYVFMITIGDPSGVPSGWQEIEQIAYSFGGFGTLYRKVASGESGATYTWTGVTTDGGAIGIRVAEADTTTPEADSSINQGSSVNLVHSSVTTTESNSLLLAMGFFFFNSFEISVTPPSGFNELIDDWDGNFVFFASEAIQASAGASGNKTSVTTEGVDYVSVLVAVNPGSGGEEPITETKTVSAKARIKKAAVTKTIQAKARIKGLGVTKTIQSKARIKQTSITKTVQAEARILKAVTQSVQAKARISATGITKTISAKAFIHKDRVSKVVLVSPEDESSGPSPVTFVWEIPDSLNDENIHCQIQVDDTDNTFGSVEADSKSWEDAGFEYFDGEDWVEYPAEGVDAQYSGNQARVTINLSNGVKYWRVRGRIG